MTTADTKTEVHRTSRPSRHNALDLVLVSGSFWPREGGAERQMREVLSAATQAGLRCAVLTQALPDRPCHEVVEGVSIHRVGSARLLSRLPRLGQIVCTVDQVRRLLRLRPRTAVTIQIGAASVAVAMVRHLCRTRHVVRLTGGGTAVSRSEPWARRRSRLGRLIVRFVIRRDVTVVSPARHLLADLHEAFPDAAATTLVIANGVTEPNPTPNGPTARSGVVWYARGGAVKSISAFTAIAEACPELPFLAIGRTDDLPSTPSVRRLGWVPDPYDVLSGCRVLLNTSPTEGMPNMALQALATGMYVVGPANAGLLELAETYPDRVVLVDITRPDVVATALRAVHARALPDPADVPRSADVAQVWINLVVEGSRP